MNKTVDVSVIIPTYNEGDKVARCVEALRAQKFEGTFEVIVVDNGSTKNIPAVPVEDPRIRIIREPIPGSYAARNAGLLEARGSVIAFTDSDCLPHPKWIANGYRAFASDSEVDLIAGRIDIYFADPEKPTSVELFERRFSFRQSESVKQGWAVTANLFVRQSVFNEIGPFDTKTFSGGDSEFTKRASASGLRLTYEDDAVVLHPARRTLTEISKMRRRHVGGFYKLSTNQPEFADMFSIKGIAKDFAYPIKGGALLAADVFGGRAGPLEAGRIMLVLIHTRLYRGSLKLLYKFGLKKSYERQ